ncbi:MAG TPA: alpha/beta hydrolase [Edaphobacter sp.]|nr:alpha/beta hydrolase [Edaphobacter sp.]
MSAHAFRNISFALAGFVVLALGVRLAFGRLFSTGAAPAEAVQKTATSEDGTVIAYEQAGSGPVIILLSSALADRNGARPLARQLTSTFTVINYDRRGRGKSTNTEPYAVEREVDDLQALANSAGVSVFLFGNSSGAALALDAAARLGPKVTKLFLYEPPFIVDGSRPPIPDTLIQEINASLSANKPDEAVSLFFGKGMGIPGPGVKFMRWMLPAWSDMTKIAHTAPYDLMVLAGTQSGKPLPVDRWAHASSPTLVAVGSKGEPFFHSGAKALAGTLSAAQYRSLDGLDHSAVLLAPKAIAAAIREFFGNR